MRITRFSFLILFLFGCLTCHAQSAVAEHIEECGKFEHWRVMEIKESGIIGGNIKHIYKMDTGDTIKSNEPYKPNRQELFAPCNIMANVIGIIKTSNSVFPEKRGDGYCAKMEVVIEKVKVLGMINIDAVAQGTVLIGSFIEPVRDTKNPYGKIRYGIPFTDRPKGLQYDYKAIVGKGVTRATGLSPRKYLGYADYPEIQLFLQKRWEDEEGNIHALRVGTAVNRIFHNIPEWINGEVTEILYGDITGRPEFRDYMGLRPLEMSFYAWNSKGEGMPVIEEGWADPDEIPTHIIIVASSSYGEAFYGGIGNTLWIDNLKLVY